MVVEPCLGLKNLLFFQLEFERLKPYYEYSVKEVPGEIRIGGKSKKNPTRNETEDEGERKPKKGIRQKNRKEEQLETKTEDEEGEKQSGTL
ncbi:hypothetical protein JTB14_001153 [Gonioctena quinquepunctata]|nr:hypothetical protein JTB14_001153 [Gonioctena quinquepunctata]